jgi:hypothetical protein
MNQNSNASIIWGTSEESVWNRPQQGVPIPSVHSKTEQSLSKRGFPIKMEVAKLVDASMILFQ